jgi:hypothetical protein
VCVDKIAREKLKRRKEEEGRTEKIGKWRLRRKKRRYNSDKGR